MSGIMPMVAVLTAVGLVTSIDYFASHIQKPENDRRWSSPAIALVTLAVAAPFVAVNWGPTSLVNSVVPFTGVTAPCERLSDAGACHHPPLGGNWHVGELMTVLVEDSKCNMMTCEVAVLGHRQDYFSDESLNYSLVLYYPKKSRRLSLSFYPERKIQFKRVAGSEQEARKQVKHADYVVVLLSDVDRQSGFRNYFMHAEQDLSGELIHDATNRQGDLRILMRADLPTGERLVLIKRQMFRDGL